VAEALPLIGIHDHNGEEAVVRLERFGRRQVWMAIALASRARTTTREEVGDRIGQEAERRGEQADVEMLAAAAAETMDERGVHGPERVESGGQVGDGAADLRRRVTGHAGERHEAEEHTSELQSR